jgi:hypothetical protein
MTYLDMLQVYLLPQLEDHQPDVMFQQDGALPQWAHIPREFLGMYFPGRCVGHDGQISWPARLPDITPFDFFLWGYVKIIVLEDLCDLPRCSEAQNFCCDRNSYTANAREHLEGTHRDIGISDFVHRPDFS